MRSEKAETALRIAMNMRELHQLNIGNPADWPTNTLYQFIQQKWGFTWDQKQKQWRLAHGSHGRSNTSASTPTE